MTGVLNGTRPMTREDIVGYLAQIEDVERSGRSLNRVERGQYLYLRREFREEFSELGIAEDESQTSRLCRLTKNERLDPFIPDFIYGNCRNFYSYSHEDFSFYFDPILNRSFRYEDTDSIAGDVEHNKFTNGVQFWGRIGKYVAFHADARDNKEWGTARYPLGNYTLPGLGFVRSTSPDHIYHDETDAYIMAGTKHVSLTYGKFENRWGTGRTGNLMLGDAATSYDQFKIDVRYKQFHFSSIYAYLIDYKDFKGDSLQQRKYMAGHRVQFTPWHWICVGLSEAVIFRGRSFEPSYLNPLMFLRSAEHYLGSPDNMMMGLDVKFIACRNVILNAELLIDDLATGKLGSGWYGNKLGYLLGAFIAEPLGVDNLDVWLEYTRIEPYVYSHDNSLSYTHYATVLGHPIGPNSDQLVLRLNYRPHWRMSWIAEFRSYRHGDNFSDLNIGGDIDRHFGLGSDEYPDFLGGLLKDKESFSISGSYEIFRQCYFKVSYTNCFGTYEREELGRLKVNKNTVAVSLGINY
ncbi:MAG: hypothetical protein JXA91_07975 [Candidatus Thermoplasmatota archaeon]|nr:hypothetical protein [Candidatus Thermoplasmatota archaeon]